MTAGLSIPAQLEARFDTIEQRLDRLAERLDRLEPQPRPTITEYDAEIRRLTDEVTE